MAVCLLRDGEKKTQALSPEMRQLPRVMVRSQPVLAAPQWSGRLRARTPTHVSYSVPEREEVWRETFERRKVQLSECGFHGAAHRPYRDVGHVELDDPTLILDGLGQKRDSSLSPPPTTGTRSPSSNLPTTSPLPPPPPPSPPPLPSRPPLRSMAPKLPDDLSLLPDEMREVEGRRGEVRVGRGLFESLTARETAKKMAVALKEKEANRTNTIEWNTGSEVNFDPSPMSSRRTSTTKNDIRPSTVTFDLGGSHGNIRGITERRKSIASLASGHLTSDELDGDGNHGDSNHGDVISRPMTCGLSGVLEVVVEGEEGEESENGETVEEEEVKEEEDTLHHQSQIVHQWYRKLCVLLWVMDGLKLDSLTNLPPFSKCWLLDREGVARSHLHSVSRSRTLSDNQQRFTNWKNTALQHNCIKLDPVTPHGGHMTSESHTHPTPSAYRRMRRETASREQKKMRQQKQLTHAQMEELVKSVDEELNFAKKAAKSRIKKLQETRTSQLSPSSTGSTPPPSSLLPPLDMERVRERLSETEATKTMTIHYQLLAMKRDRSQALEQRLVSLRARHSLWKDLAAMREGVKMETTAMARKKLLMNFNWFQDLLEEVPDEVRTDRYCSHLLSLLSDQSRHSSVVGPEQWSKKKLIAILSRLRPWELRSPETAAAVKFLIEKVVYILSEDYERWLEYHTQLHLLQTKTVDQ